MGMTSVCSGGCGYTARSDSHRGGRLGNCPDCGQPMQAHTAGRSRGRYICPLYPGSRAFVLGLSSSIQLTEPMRLVYQTGWDTRVNHDREDPDRPGFSLRERYERAEPDRWEAEQLANAAGRVFGPGCALSVNLLPRDPADMYYGKAGNRLIPVPDADPATWFVNEPVKYKKCAACPSKVVASADTRMPEPWSPRRSWYWAAYGRRARTADTNPGPHPAGTYTCTQCDPRKPADD